MQRRRQMIRTEPSLACRLVSDMLLSSDQSNFGRDQNGANQ